MLQRFSLESTQRMVVKAELTAAGALKAGGQRLNAAAQTPAQQTPTLDFSRWAHGTGFTIQELDAEALEAFRHHLQRLQHLRYPS